MAFEGTPTGQVMFKDGNTLLASVALVQGKAAFTTSSLAKGSHKISAAYGGSANFKRSSASVTQTVN